MFRQLRDASEFGLYSQGGRWTSNQDPRNGTFKISDNSPSLLDNGEEAVTTLRYLQDTESSAIIPYLTLYISELDLSPSAIVAQYESPAVSAIDMILDGYVDTLEALTNTLSLDFVNNVNLVIDTQSSSGAVNAPSGSTSALLIGGDFATVTAKGITQGFTYNSKSPILTTIQGASGGHDVLFGFTGTNLIEANGNDNLIIGDITTPIGSSTIDITGNHNNLAGGLENETINLSGTSNSIFLGGGVDTTTLKALSENNIIYLNTSSGSMTIQASGESEENTWVRDTGTTFGITIDWEGETDLQWGQSSAMDLLDRPVVDTAKPMYYEGYYFPGYTVTDIGDDLVGSGQTISISSTVESAFETYTYTSASSGNSDEINLGVTGLTQSQLNSLGVIDITGTGTMKILSDPSYSGQLLLSTQGYEEFAEVNGTYGPSNETIVNTGDPAIDLNGYVLTLGGGSVLSDELPVPVSSEQMFVYGGGTLLGPIDIQVFRRGHVL